VCVSELSCGLLLVHLTNAPIFFVCFFPATFIIFPPFRPDPKKKRIAEGNGHKRAENEQVVSLQPLSTLSASQLQLLQERTMINTDLDLDSLDESGSSANPIHQLHLEAASVASSQTGLLHHSSTAARIS
jgi:hypothetical protein